MDDRQTAFNMNQATLMRLDEILKKAHFFSETNHLFILKITLDSLYKELSPYIAEELTDSKNKFTEMRDKVNRIFNSCNATNNSASSMSKHNSQMVNAMLALNNSQLYNALAEWEILMRALMFKKGLYMVYKQDARQAALR